MNYEKIYASLIQKRLVNKIDRTICQCEYHHIKPRSIYPELEDVPSNIIALTVKEHFFAHLLLQRIYRNKYGRTSMQYKKMLSAIRLMIDCKKYRVRRTSRLYERIRFEYYQAERHITTHNRIWVINGKEDRFLKSGSLIPDGFRRGRAINFTEEQRQTYARKVSICHIGKKAWNSGKHGLYSNEYRKKISDNHADVNGENNGRYGSRMMFNCKTQTKKLVQKNEIQQYLDIGYVFAKDLKVFNNGLIDILADKCPDGFTEGSFKRKTYWWNNGIIEKMSKNQPAIGFKRGRISKS